MDNKATEKKYPLAELTFVFTGELSIDRDEAKSRVILLGGRVTIQPSSKTSFLVAGNEPGPSKMKKAEELGIKVLDEKSFLKMIDKKAEHFDTNMIFDFSGGGETTGETELWCEKYRPKKNSDFIGNAPIVKQLKDFLDGQTKMKAALLSGPPGIGKTTLAHFVAKQEGFEVIEFNASDVRSKSELVAKVSKFINFKSISKGGKPGKKVLVMDEIDGMTSDRGGLVELTSIIKKSSIPIICICNDRYHLKIRTIANHCLDLRFRKIEARTILPRIQFILKEEKKEVSEALLKEIILISNGDIRYILNTLQNLLTKKNTTFEQVSKFIKKSAMKNIFDLSAEIFQNKKISEKIEIYFEDYAFIPLMVHENYLKINFKGTRSLFEAADAISMSDIFDKKIHGPNQMWSLAPSHAFYGSVLPTRQGILGRRIEFPVYLGKTSTTRKNKKILVEFTNHAFKSIRSDYLNTRKYYLDLILGFYMEQLREINFDGCLKIIDEYCLLKEDVDNSFVLCDMVDDYKNIPTGTKSGLTRAYNKNRKNLGYSDGVERSVKDEEEIEESEEDLNAELEI